MIAPFVLVALALTSADGQSSPRRQTDIYIRRAAGLPDASARGDIELLDVGHDPMDTMLSIVARRTAEGSWRVSYACAKSPRCAPDVDHAAKDYVLSRQASASVDAIVDRLRAGSIPEIDPAEEHFIGGWLDVTLTGAPFRHFHRVGRWEPDLGALRTALAPPATTDR